MSNLLSAKVQQENADAAIRHVQVEKKNRCAV
jgi:hypothetical protein